MRAAFLFLPTFSICAGCVPDFGDSPSLVTSPRVLAVLAEPPEAGVGESVALRVLVASPAGPIADAAPAWAFCFAPKPLADNNVVGPACLDDQSIKPIGAAVMAVMPFDACSRFGPDVPPQPAGQPPLRPHDPDVTGGYYQPVRADLAGLPPTFSRLRVTCNLAGATAAVAAEFRTRYRPNHNPRIARIAAFDGANELPLDRLPAGGRVRLVATFAPDAAEFYPVLDVPKGILTDRRESLRASFFITGGHLDKERPGEFIEGATGAEAGWTLPAGPTVLPFWVVVRDERGGVDVMGGEARAQ